VSSRKVMKILHEIGSVGYLGGIAALLVLLAVLPDPSEFERHAQLRIAMGEISRLVIFPSVIAVLCSGLMSIAIVPAYQSAGWVWAKLATGILVFEGTLVYILGPMRRAGAQGAGVLSGEVAPSELGATLGAETGSLWVLGAVALANVVLGVWRPRWRRRRETAEA